MTIFEVVLFGSSFVFRSMHSKKGRKRGTSHFSGIITGASKGGSPWAELSAQQQLCWSTGLYCCRCSAYCKQGWPIVEALLSDSGEVAICSNQHLCTDGWVAPVKVDCDSALILIVLSHLQHGRHRLLKTSTRHKECTSSLRKHCLIAT